LLRRFLFVVELCVYGLGVLRPWLRCMVCN